MMIWQSDSEESTEVKARILDSQGAPVTAEITLDSGTATLGHPSVTALPNGDFVAAWTSMDKAGGGPWIRYQVFDRKGSAFGQEKTAISCEPVPGDFPRVIAMAAGGFAMAWEVPGGKGIHVVQFDSAGSLLGGGWVARDSTGSPVLESLDGTGWVPAVTWGLYGFDGETPTASGYTTEVTIERCQ